MKTRIYEQLKVRPTRIDYAISIDRAFLWFADDCGVDAQQLFYQAEQAILRRHYDAIPDRAPSGAVRTDVWCLNFGPACVIYTIKDKTAFILEYLCNANGQNYEPSQDLLAGLP